MPELKELTELVKYMLHLDKEVEEAEKWVAQLKRDRERFNREHIPDLMADIGVNELKLDSGETISVGKTYYANISEDRSEAAFKWLKENGQEALIKTVVAHTFGAGLEEKVDYKIMTDFLKEKEIDFVEKKAVHPQTLKAFVRTQIESPEKAKNFPAATFGVYITDETVVKANKHQ